MEYLKNKIYLYENLIFDFIALGVSVLILQIPFIFPLMGGIVDWERINLNILTGIFFYWIILYLFCKVPRLNELLAVALAIILGSILWTTSQLANIFYFNWQYFSHIPSETFYERLQEIAKYTFTVFAPIQAIISSIFIVLLRAIKKIGKTVWTTLFHIFYTQKL